MFDFQYVEPLPFGASARLSPQSLGVKAETWAASWFRKQGFDVSHPSQGSDLVLVHRDTGQVARVEVKSSRRSKVRNQWQFCLYKTEHTTTYISDYLLLLPVVDGGVVPFLIPVDELSGVKTITMAHPLVYQGRYAVYRLVRGTLSFRDANGNELAPGDVVRVAGVNVRLSQFVGRDKARVVSLDTGRPLGLFELRRMFKL